MSESDARITMAMLDEFERQMTTGPGDPDSEESRLAYEAWDSWPNVLRNAVPVAGVLVRDDWNTSVRRLVSLARHLVAERDQVSARLGRALEVHNRVLLQCEEYRQGWLASARRAAHADRVIAAREEPREPGEEG